MSHDDDHHDAADTPAADGRQGENGASEAPPPTPERRGSGFLNFFSSFLGSKPDDGQPADPEKNTVWLLDNTAYQRVAADKSQQTPSWHAEVVACIFNKEDQHRHDVGKYVATIADKLGLDGEVGKHLEARKRIETRVEPFLDQVSPSRTLTLEITVNGQTQSHPLNPSDANGIISQEIDLGAVHVADDTAARAQCHQPFDPKTASMSTRFAGKEGWLVVSDIDDTIKRTLTPERTGILRSTFADEPEAIPGMPEFYHHVRDELSPAWFYVSASPYNLYTFLHDFVHNNYCPGTLVLRDYSWMDIDGLVKSFTENTQDYKVDRIEKIHRWFPNRKVLCIGDSTQKDPEAYAEIYRRYPNWVHAIIIRKVTDAPHMEEKNIPERFEKAFQDVPSHVWTLFEDPLDLYKVVDGLGMEDQTL